MTRRLSAEEKAKIEVMRDKIYGYSMGRDTPKILRQQGGQAAKDA